MVLRFIVVIVLWNAHFQGRLLCLPSFTRVGNLAQKLRASFIS